MIHLAHALKSVRFWLDSGLRMGNASSGCTKSGTVLLKRANLKCSIKGGAGRSISEDSGDPWARPKVKIIATTCFLWLCTVPSAALPDFQSSYKDNGLGGVMRKRRGQCLALDLRQLTGELK